jgi:hypothetical protein
MYLKLIRTKKQKLPSFTAKAVFRRLRICGRFFLNYEVLFLFLLSIYVKELDSNTVNITTKNLPHFSLYFLTLEFLGLVIFRRVYLGIQCY